MGGHLLTFSALLTEKFKPFRYTQHKFLWSFYAAIFIAVLEGSEGQWIFLAIALAVQGLGMPYL